MNAEVSKIIDRCAESQAVLHTSLNAWRAVGASDADVIDLLRHAAERGVLITFAPDVHPPHDETVQVRTAQP